MKEYQSLSHTRWDCKYHVVFIPKRRKKAIYGALRSNRKLVEQFGMQASMSRKGNCYDNAPMESFWGSLKNELIHHHRYATRADAKAAIQEYIESFYNRQRRHSRLGNVPPALFAENLSKQPQAA